MTCEVGLILGLTLSLMIRHMLMIVDNEEFYEREKPLSLQDIRLLIIILKQVSVLIDLILQCVTLTSRVLGVMIKDNIKYQWRD